MFALACVCGTRLSAQTTEGKDFWVTFMRADTTESSSTVSGAVNKVNPITLSLAISSRENGQVTLSNPNTGWNQSYSVNANQVTNCDLYFGSPRQKDQTDNKGCYSYQSETPTWTAIHVEATVPVSVYASNLKEKTFDATNVLPTSALDDHYIVQTYPPSDHGGAKQGSHFAIIATENNTQVEITPTAQTAKGKTTKFTTPVLQKGQVYYVWTGNQRDGAAADFSGTEIQALNEKKIALFQGCPHTNIPDSIRNRDHIFSVAMPTVYWGNTFVVTSSMTRHRDIVRVLAEEDGTTVTVRTATKTMTHTFDFATNPKRTFEFELGEPGANISGSKNKANQSCVLSDDGLLNDSSCIIETSCPCAVHLFMASNTYDGTTLSDPAMVWISPIEQKISEITFATFGKANEHYANIITDNENVQSMTMDGVDISNYFHPVSGSNRYSFARVTVSNTAHTLVGESGFVAHVYGYRQNESYAYSVGSAAAKTSMTINGTILQNDTVSTKRICINEDIRFESKFDASINQVLWDMGDGQTFTQENAARFTYKYESPGLKQIQAIGSLTNSCTGESYTDTIRVAIMLGRADTIRRGQRLCVEDPTTYTGKLNDTVSYDCDSVLVYHMELGQATSSEIERTARDGYKWHGETYYESGDYQYTTENYNGCDSVVTLHLTVEKCLHMKVSAPSSIICADEEDVRFPYEIEQGDPSDAYLVINGTKYPLGYVMTGDNTGYLSCPMRYLKAGSYSTEIVVTDLSTLCNQILHFKVSFTVQYASSVFKQKWTNVLAVRDSAYNGGYNFVGFQWYCNGQPVPGATSPNYYTDSTLTEGDEWFVMLTRDDGVVLPSCPQIINFDHSQNPAPERVKESSDAKKAVEQQRFVIIRDEKRYDVFGRRIQ